MANNVIQAEFIRRQARQIGYDATNAKTTIFNPYERDNPFHEAWQDGYDLGILDSREESINVL